jgi:putative peptide zinc metalloprotease protein
VNRMTRALLSSVVAAAVVVAPTAAGASDENVVIATNQTDGAAVVEASVQYRKAANRVVDEVNYSRAEANCVDCQTVATAFQLVLIPKDVHTFVPHNEADAFNVLCAECVTWATAKQVLVATGGPAALSEAGHARMRALEDRLLAMEDDLPAMTLGAVQAELNDAFAELLAIADEEVVRTDGGPDDAEVVAARSA